jgi:hypothetical protein
MHDSRCLIVFPDTNCWRGEVEFIDMLKKLHSRGICKIASSYIVAKECATADTIGRSCAALSRVLEHTDCWLRGRDEIMRGAVSYLNYGWQDEITVTLLPFEARRLRAHWERELRYITTGHEESRKDKVRMQKKWTELGIDNRNEFVRQARTVGFVPQSLDEKELREWIWRCFDPDNKEWGGILLDEILESPNFEKERIGEVLARFDQFPGLKLSYGHLLHSFVSHIRGERVDKSFVQDTLILLPISTKTMFVTNDRAISRTAGMLGMSNLVCTPTVALNRLEDNMFDK